MTIPFSEPIDCSTFKTLKSKITMSAPSPLLALPTEIRLQIYSFYFSSCIVRTCTNIRICVTGTPLRCLSSKNSLWLVCKQLRLESAPLLFPHALFWVDSFLSLVCMLKHHTPAQIQSIRHFAIQNSLVPLPQPNPTPEPAVVDVGLGTATAAATLREDLYRAFYEQICAGLETLVLFNTTDAGTRRRILQQQAGREFTEEEFEKSCLDRMRLKAHLFVPVLREHGVGRTLARGGSGDEGVPFRIMLRYLGIDGMVCIDHGM